MKNRWILFFFLLLGATTVLPAAPLISFTVVDSMSHDPSSFTQGLFFQGHELWECTGLVGRSQIIRRDLKSGLLKRQNIPSRYFGEGCVIADQELVSLTWRDGVALRWSLPDLSRSGTFTLPGEGWGLGLWRDYLVMSDGSASLQLWTRLQFQLQAVVAVTHQGKPVRWLNELEVVGDYVWANIWQSDSIAYINLRSGEVEGWLDLHALAQVVRQKHPSVDVLNGIAWDGRLLWVTGKLWPELYALKIHGSQPQK